MFIGAQIRPLEQDELRVRRKALRDAVICIGWMKLVSVICYVSLYILIHASSKGNMSLVLQVLTLVTIPLQVLHGILLFMGALEEKLMSLELALWLSLILASYNTVLGVIGGIYFIRTGHLTLHFLLAVIFAMMALSLFTVLCHDILIIYAFKQMLLTTSSRNRDEEGSRAITYVQDSQCS